MIYFRLSSVEYHAMKVEEHTQLFLSKLDVG